MLKHSQVYKLANIFLIKKLKNLTLLHFKSQLYKLHTNGELISCIQEIYKPTNHVNFRMKDAIIKIIWENLFRVYEEYKLH